MKTVKFVYREKQYEIELKPIGDYKNEPYDRREGRLQKIHINDGESIWVWVWDEDLKDFNDCVKDKVLLVTLMNSSLYGYPWGTALPVMFNEEHGIWEFNFKDLNLNLSERAEYNGERWSVWMFSYIEDGEKKDGVQHYEFYNKYGDHITMDENEMYMIYNKVEEMEES